MSHQFCWEHHPCDDVLWCPNCKKRLTPEQLKQAAALIDVEPRALISFLRQIDKTRAWVPYPCEKKEEA